MGVGGDSPGRAPPTCQPTMVGVNSTSIFVSQIKPGCLGMGGLLSDQSLHLLGHRRVRASGILGAKKTQGRLHGAH